MTPITTQADAELAIGDLARLVEKISSIIEQETTLVRAGQLRRASALEQSQRLRTNAEFLKSAPGRCAELAKMQDNFRALLQKNMVVLATAHAVSEGIMRRLSKDLARKAGPQVYGASGRAAAPNPKHGRPLAISRSL